MEDELKVRLTKYLDALEAGVTKAGDFVGDQAPEVAREYLLWEYWWHLIGVIVFGSLLLVAAIVIWRLWKKFGHDDDCQFGLGMGGTMVMVGLITGTGVNLHHVIKVTVAPRVVLIERVAGALKGK